MKLSEKEIRDLSLSKVILEEMNFNEYQYIGIITTLLNDKFNEDHRAAINYLSYCDKKWNPKPRARVDFSSDDEYYKYLQSIGQMCIDEPSDNELKQL